jgi:hypothetical protein
VAGTYLSPVRTLVRETNDVLAPRKSWRFLLPANINMLTHGMSNNSVHAKVACDKEQNLEQVVVHHGPRKRLLL